MKFRGRTEEGKWVEGYLCIIGNEYLIRPILPTQLLEDLTFTERRSLTNFWWTNKILDYLIYGFIPIIDKSLSMSTGQLDKHDKEIFSSIELDDGTMSEGGDRLKNNPDDDDWDDDVIWWKEKSRFELRSFVNAMRAAPKKTALERISIKASMLRLIDCVQPSDNPSIIIGSQFETDLKSE